MTRYDSHTSSWSQHRILYDRPLTPLETPPSALGLVAQRITLEPLSEPVVCCVFPAFQIDPETPVAFDPGRRNWFGQSGSRTSRLVSASRRPVFMTPCKSRVTPQQGTLSTLQIGGLLQPWSLPDGDRCSDRPASAAAGRLDGLRNVAAQALRERQIDPDDRFRAARALGVFLA